MFDDEFQIINLIMGVNFETEFNISSIIKVLPVSYCNIGCVKKIEYYEVNNVVVRISAVDRNRGIIKLDKNGKEKKTTMTNIIDIDYQNQDKNIHFKLSKENIHVTGIKSYNMFEKCIDNFIKLLVETEEKLKSLLESNKVETIINAVVEASDGKYNYLNPVFFDRLHEISNRDDFDIVHTELLLGKTCEELNPDKLRSLLLSDVNLTPFPSGNYLYNEIPRGKDIEIYNGMYTFIINKRDIVLMKLSVILEDEYDKKVYYVKSEDNSLTIKDDIKIEDISNMNNMILETDNKNIEYFSCKYIPLLYNIKNKGNNEKFHQMKIAQNGRIQLNSSSTLCVIENVVKELHEIINDIYGEKEDEGY